MCGHVRSIFAPPLSLESQGKVSTVSALKELHALREKEVREEIAQRLRGVCGGFPNEDFEQMVNTMAERQLRDERRLVW